MYVVVTGPPASGKSTLSRELARLPPEAMGPLAGPWPVVEVDTSGVVDVPDVAAQVRRTRSHP